MVAALELEGECIPLLDGTSAPGRHWSPQPPEIGLRHHDFDGTLPTLMLRNRRNSLNFVDVRNLAPNTLHTHYPR